MPQNVYSLPDLIDLALKVPEVGAVNFNILHTILQAIVKELQLTDVRPFCQIEDSFIIKASQIKAKLKEVQQKNVVGEQYVTEKAPDPEVRRHLISQTPEDDTAVRKDEKGPLQIRKASAQASTEESGEFVTLKRKDSAVQTEYVESQDDEFAPTETGEVTKSQDTEFAPTETEEVTKSEDTEYAPTETKEVAKSEDTEYAPTETKEVAKSQDTEFAPTETKEATKAQDTELAPTETKEVTKSQETAPTKTKKVTMEQDIEVKEASQSQDTKAKTGRTKREDLIIPETTRIPLQKKSDDTKPPSRKIHSTQDAWNYTKLSTRVEATEEGLDRLGNIVDIIATKMKRTEQRKKEGGPAAEELESIDERLLEMEAVFEQFGNDHALLTDMNDLLKNLMDEFEKIKALAALLKQMQIDISKKADKEETWAALALKGDLEMLKTKVDRIEFETAIEELGEAIGLLGLKFTRKNEEWEERAAEIWKAIDSKMTFDVFEAARIKIESRLTALMYGLRKLKKVVEDLLYPEASGVTRCILCRRPACISGLECLECIGIFGSPKRPLSSRSSAGNGDPHKLKKSSSDAIHKKQKLDVPPYCQSQDTIISKPYSSASSRSSAGGKESIDTVQMKLKPVSSRRGSAHSSKSSEVPKLPDIDERNSRPNNKSVSVIRSKTKSNGQTPELYFTKKMLAKMESKSSSKDQKYRFTAVLEVEPTKTVTIKTSTKSPATNVDLTPDPAKTMDEFAPARLMPDTLRRNILLSPTSPKDKKVNMTLSPLQFDT